MTRPALFSRLLMLFVAACLDLVSVQATVAETTTEPAVAESAAEASAYRLRYRFEPGQIVRYETSQEAMLKTTKRDVTETARNRTETEKHFRVVAVDAEGVATLETVIDRIQMSIRFGDGRPVAFDSRKPEDAPPALGGISEAVGKPLAELRVAANGELLSARPLIGPELEGPVAMPGGDKDDDPSQSFLVVFPEEPLRVGEGWRDQFKVRVKVAPRLTQEVTLLRQYKLTGVKDGVARIKLTTSVITPIHDPSLAAQLIQKAPSGTIAFDLERGLIARRVMTVDQTEVGAIGTASTMHAQSRLEERLVGSAEFGVRSAE